MPRRNHRDPAVDPGAFFGNELRLIREAAGYRSQDALAVRMRTTQPGISRVEVGSRPPTDAFLNEWLDVCNVAGPYRDLIVRLSAIARRGEGPVPRWFLEWVEVEAQARFLRLWQPLVLPGPFQVPDYARALFIASGTDPDSIEERVKAREARRALIYRPSPPRVVAVLDEHVLYRLVGSQVIMCAALSNLAEIARLPHVQVHVIPRANGANAGLFGTFSLASIDSRPDVLLMENVEDNTTTSQTTVRTAEIAFESVRGDALPRTASLEKIREALDTWNSQ